MALTTKVAEKRVFRSRDAYVGGVCAGLAERFDLDPIVVRILAIFIVLLTLGLGVVPYCILWARLPLQPESIAPYEVRPESAESSAYGCVDCVTGRAMAEDRGSGVDGTSMLVRLAVAVGLVLLFLAVATNLSPLMPGTEWWQFWPLGLLICGLCLIIIPIPIKSEAAWHAIGIVVTSLSAALLPMSLGLVSWNTVPSVFAQAWPLLAAAALLFGFGAKRGRGAFMVGAAFLVVAFCVIALTLCAVPGDLETLLFSMPDGRVIRLTIIAW